MNLNNWMEAFKELLGRPLQPSDPLFPRFDVAVGQIDFVENMFMDTAMKTVNAAVFACAIISLTSVREVLKQYTAHFFRIDGCQNRFVPGTSR